MQATRVSDIGTGTCYAGHSDVKRGDPKSYVTTHVSGANTVFTNNLPQAIIGTIGQTDCGHTTTAVSGSDTVFAEYMPIHRLGDIGVINEGDGEHVVVTASDDVSN